MRLWKWIKDQSVKKHFYDDKCYYIGVDDSDDDDDIDDDVGDRWYFSYCSVTDVVMHTFWIVAESDVWANFTSLARPGSKTEIRGLTSVRHRTDKGRQLKYWMSGWLIFFFLYGQILSSEAHRLWISQAFPRFVKYITELHILRETAFKEWEYLFDRSEDWNLWCNPRNIISYLGELTFWITR